MESEPQRAANPDEAQTPTGPAEVAPTQETPSSPEEALSRSEEFTGRIEDAVDERLGAAALRAGARVPESMKPKLRGWLHAGAVPVVLVLGTVLICLSNGTAEKVAASIYAVTTVLLFSVSAIYHRGNWTPRATQVLKRLDHANIFLLIAGTYTPFAVLLLNGGQRVVLLVIAWTGALLGVGFRVFWVGAPRWLYVPAYALLGWVAVFYLPALTESGGVAVVTLIAVGGLFYTVGGIVYGTKRPDPFPGWFGFHEVFHSLTIVAYVCQYIAVSIAVYTH